ncbi:MAG: L,D-transpeptidase [Candidatus Peribacteraceae bacterium]|nr:L,D-transpeptidase [Candidatus Peribacteraceae bacterium]
MSFFTTPLIGSFFVAAALFAPMPAAYQVSLATWEPGVGDRVVVDTKENEGYLIHTDGRYVRFPVITGQRRRVYYIGRSYNAATPAWDWVVQSQDIKGDRITFGPSGRFLRLYKDGEEHTAYGFHEHAAEDVMFDRESRFQSMGCVIVRSSMMDILEETYLLNTDAGVPVFTRYGIEDAVRIAFPRDDANVL